MSDKKNKELNPEKKSNDYIEAIKLMSVKQQKSLFIIATIFTETELGKVTNKIQEDGIKSLLLSLL